MSPYKAHPGVQKKFGTIKLITTFTAICVAKDITRPNKNAGRHNMYNFVILYLTIIAGRQSITEFRRTSAADKTYTWNPLIFSVGVCNT
jgi:hypothetical protein